MAETERIIAIALLCVLLLLFGVFDALVCLHFLNMSTFYASVIHGALVALLALENWSLVKDVQRLSKLVKDEQRLPDTRTKDEDLENTVLHLRLANALLQRQNEILLNELRVHKSKEHLAKKKANSMADLRSLSSEMH